MSMEGSIGLFDANKMVSLSSSQWEELMATEFLLPAGKGQCSFNQEIPWEEGQWQLYFQETLFKFR